MHADEGGPRLSATVSMTFRRGDTGPAVSQIVGLLSRLGLIDGDPPDSYDDRVEFAVRTFQQQRGLHVDGVVGAATFRRLDEARWSLGDRILTHLPGNLIAGDDVFTLQRRLLELGFKVGRVDGYFGSETESALREFQRNFGIPADGTCGPATLKALAQLAPMVRGGAPNAMRSQERIRAAGPQLGGKIVVIDPARSHQLPAEHARARRGGRPRPRVADRGSPGRDRRTGVPHRLPGRTAPLRAGRRRPRRGDRAGDLRQPHPGQPVHLAGGRRLCESRRLRGRHLFLRRRGARDLVVGG